MKIEILYSELYIYGEKESALFFAEIMKNKGHEVIMTEYHDTPQFSKEKVDCIYISVISERFLDKVVKKLLPYRQQLIDNVEGGTYLIAFGSALDLFSKELFVSNSVFDEVDGVKDSLAIFDYNAYRDYRNRRANMSVFKMDGVDDVVMGSIISFSKYRYNNKGNELYSLMRGEDNFLGYNYKNVYLFEVVGCLFIFNPNLLKYFFEKWNEDFEFERKNEIMKAYHDKKNLWIKFGKIGKLPNSITEK